MESSHHPSSSYNDLHTDFVTTTEGISLRELLQILGSISLTPILVPFLLAYVVTPGFAKQAVQSSEFFSLIRTIVEYPLIIVLPIWIITVFSGAGDTSSSSSSSIRPVDCSGLVLVTIACIPLGILIVNHAITSPKWLGFKGHWSKIKEMPTGWTKMKKEEAITATAVKLPFLTSYRAIVLYITILCILAVDFPIFPRRFAKTKTYGISLMDVGTGCFIFSNGIVAPEARNKRAEFGKSVKAAVPIIVLGFVRLITVKGIEYQEVVEEYGVHWNFFFTLAGVKLLSSFIFTSFNPSKSLRISVILAIIYELLLNFNDLQNQYILNPSISRSSNLLNANREGVFSTVGYLVIYLASVYFGKLIYFKKRITISEWGSYAVQTFLQLGILWALYGVSPTLGYPPCRRTANLSYVLLMTALNYSLLWFQMFLGLLQISLQHLGLIYGPMLFYEMKDYEIEKKDHLHVHQKMEKDFIEMKRKHQRREMEGKRRNEEFDRKLEELEEAVELLQKEKMDGELNLETLRRISSLEEEIQKLEEKLHGEEEEESQEEDDDEGEENKKSLNSRNFVVFPDFSKCPVVLEAICYNGLFIFLLGNLMTGLINCFVYTMYTPPYLALLYLWLYATVIAVSSLALFWYKIQLKFW